VARDFMWVQVHHTYWLGSVGHRTPAKNPCQD
jgi:hypothetical protein